MVRKDEELNGRKIMNYLVCVRRKVKCDSQRPCTNCRLRGEEKSCVYSSRKRPGPRYRKEPENINDRLGMKRPRISPSIATGLIGMEESHFLDILFLGITDFYPVVDEICIRECMVTYLGILEKQRELFGEVFRTIRFFL